MKERVCIQTFYWIRKFYKRAITPRELAPSPCFFLYRYTLLISMCLQKLMNIHRCIFKILGKNKTASRTATKNLQRPITPRELAPSPYFFHMYVHLIDIKYLQKLMNIHCWVFKILGKNQSVADGHKILQRATTPWELASSPYFFLCRYT